MTPTKLVLSFLFFTLLNTVTAAEDTMLDTIEVRAPSIKTKLNQSTEVSSYLGLKPKETPASIYVVNQDAMQEQGLRSMIDVYNSTPGVRAGNLPGEPGTTTMRGFSRGATGYLVDGIRAVDSLLSSRNYDTYNFERVEVLKGPASVINGTGALAGAINLVTRQPKLGKASQDMLLSYGSFGTYRVGASFNQPINTSTAINTSLSYGKSKGYIDDTDSETFGFTTGFLNKATDRLTLSGSINYFQDHFKTAYFGTPLIPFSSARRASNIVSTSNSYVIDESLKEKNYDVTDGLMKSDTLWLRTKADYKLNDTWKINNELSFFTSDRHWSNAEDFTFNATTQLLDRATTLITHDHQFWSDRLMVLNDQTLGGKRNRFSAGAEYISTQLKSKRRFGDTTAVDPFNPIRGFFPVDNNANFSYRQNFNSDVSTIALFAEDALHFTPKWLGVAGIRYEKIDLHREIDNLITGNNSSFDKNYHNLSWRVGSVYNLTDSSTVYAQYNRGAVPVTTLLLSNISGAGFKLSYGQSVEAGIKSFIFDGKGTATLAVYHIDQDDILTRDANNPALTIQGGSQRSKGIEFDVEANLTPRWKINANASVQKAEYTTLLNSSGQSMAGNRPSNVPNQTLNLTSTYTLKELPLTIGVGVRHAGNFYTDTANTIKVNGHTLFDASLSYPLDKGTLTLRGRNLSNKFYADWSGYSETQVYLGAPRSVDLTYSIKF